MTDIILKLEDVRKSYYLENWKEIPVLNWINLEVKKNELIAIMWESWSWKSTLLNIIWCDGNIIFSILSNLGKR